MQFLGAAGGPRQRAGGGGGELPQVQVHAGDAEQWWRGHGSVGPGQEGGLGLCVGAQAGEGGAGRK